MWVRFSKKVLDALYSAGHAASERGAKEVSPEDLLIAILEDADSFAFKVLSDIGVDATGIRMAIQQTLDQREASEKLVPVMSPQAKKAIDFVSYEAKQAGRTYTAGTHHLLLALLTVEKGTLKEVLGTISVTLPQVIRGVEGMLGDEE